MTKSRYTSRTQKVRITREGPVLSFNQMCYGYLQNDWITVLSSGVTLVVTFFTIVLASVSRVCTSS